MEVGQECVDHTKFVGRIDKDRSGVGTGDQSWVGL